MSRVVIDLPEQFSFRTEIDVLISHVNAANHVGNHEIVGILNEARVRYFKEIGYSDNHERGLINADLAVVYKSESKYGDILVVEIAANAFQKYGCDFVFRVTEKNSGRLVTEAKMALLMFDYSIGKLVEVPENFEQFFSNNR